MTREQSELNEILDLSLIADVLQILNFWLNLKQVSSDALMQELKNQDSSYLDKLIAAFVENQGRFEMAWIAGIAHPLLS